jgi:hypothetical protein
MISRKNMIGGRAKVELTVPKLREEKPARLAFWLAQNASRYS